MVVFCVFEEQLITLISAAKEHEVEFIYAISPGLDITLSNPKEVAALKRKLSQVIGRACYQSDHRLQETFTIDKELPSALYRVV